MNPAVSIITISQRSRMKCLQNLAHLVNAQDYTNIIEWIIVEGSQTEADARMNQHHIKSMVSTVPIKYLEYEPGLKLSDLRNKGNDVCQGDIIVVMDDDDYYPSCRVSHAVTRLQESDCQIAGTSNVYMYDYDVNQMFQFRGFGQNHATNNTMAYEREYLAWNRHAPGLKNAEEKSFTRGFQNFMVQLDPDKCVIVSSHGANTVSKKMFIGGGYMNIVNNPIVPAHVLESMKNALHTSNEDAS